MLVVVGSPCGEEMVLKPILGVQCVRMALFVLCPISTPGIESRDKFSPSLSFVVRGWYKCGGNVCGILLQR